MSRQECIQRFSDGIFWDVDRNHIDLSQHAPFVVHALEEGMSPQIVMTFTGHEDYDSLKPYIAITDKTRKNLMTTMFSK